MHPLATVTSPRDEVHEHAGPGFLTWVAELVRLHRARLIAYARRRGLTAEESLDAVQDSFASLLTLPGARHLARSGDDAIKFLTVILRNNVQNLRRTRDRRDRALTMAAAHDPERAESSEALVARAEELARVNGCIQVMARLQRAVIMLSLVDDLGHDETSAMLGVSPEYVRVLLHRARAHVRSCAHDDAPR